MDLTIVIVSRNTASLLANSLTSFRDGARALGCGVIVVDNASTDGSPELITREFPNVQLIRNSENIGFGRANNQGWRVSHSKYVLFLNSDTLVPPGALAQLIEFMNSHPDAGVCSPRLLCADGTTQSFAFGCDPTPAYLLARGWSRVFLHRPRHDWETRDAQTVDWVSGACLLARRNALERVDGFDEEFFMYFEDNDLCLRIRRAGWKIFYNPQVTITHLGGASLAQGKTRTHYYDVSLRYFYAKHYSRLARVALEMMLPFYRRIN